jgi:biotin operon repressor
MNPNLPWDQSTSPPRSAIPRIFTAGEARAALAELPPNAPVLLANLADLGESDAAADSRWDLGLESSEVLYGPSALRLDLRARLAFCGDVELNLTFKEFALLQTLLSADGAELSADHLSQAIWGRHMRGSQNSVEAHISRLRRKLLDAGAGRVIQTVRGRGYSLRQPHPVPELPSPVPQYGSGVRQAGRIAS